MNDQRIQSSLPVLESARLLHELHLLTVRGLDQGPEADAIREQMETPWYAMTPVEQERIGGLSEDLYALAEDGPPCVGMSDQELNEWKKELAESKCRYLQGDVDAWLAFWRKPRPDHFPGRDGIPLAVIRFIQAQCWDQLGDNATAAFFRKAAENLVMDQLTRVA